MSEIAVNSQGKAYVVDGNMMLLIEPYIVFADPEVERICATTWGDGVGLKPSQAAAVTGNLGTVFRGTAITSFDELHYFTNVTGIYGNNSSSSPGAFGGCTSLTSITFGPKISSVGYYAFYNCSSLEQITISRSFSVSGVSHIFYGCSKLKRINIPSISVWIGCTWGNSGLNGVSPGYSSKEIHLYIDDEEVTSIDLSSETTIKQRAFECCKGITSVTWPSSSATFAVYAFYYCTGITGDLTIPSNWTTNQYAFAGLSGITNLTINKNVTDTLHFAPYDGSVYTGNGSGVMTINGNLTISSSTQGAAFIRCWFKKIHITGNVNVTASNTYLLNNISGSPVRYLKIDGNFTTGYTGVHYNHPVVMLAIGGQITNGTLSGYLSTANVNRMIHLGYEGIACAPSNIASNFGKITKVYVGDGSSASHDDAILAQYTADTNWSSYTSKLDTWYNYINDPNANPDYID